MTYHARVTEAGAVEFPEELVRELAITPGGSVMIERENGQLVLKTYQQVVREVQARFRELRGPDTGESLVDELIAERRADARREQQELQSWLTERE